MIERHLREARSAAGEVPARSACERPLRLVVADDQDLVRSGFRLILSSYDGFSIVGEARDGEEAVELARRLVPDVVLMDIRMPHLNGIEATRAITGDPALADVRVLILTTFDIDEYVYDALAAGAGGFLLKDAEPDDIAAAVRVVAAGDALIQPSVMRRLVETFVRMRPAAGAGVAAGEGGSAFSALTEREREILVQVARGMTNDEIGAELFISPATVKTHLARIMAKLDAHDRARRSAIAPQRREAIVLPPRVRFATPPAPSRSRCRIVLLPLPPPCKRRPRLCCSVTPRPFATPPAPSRARLAGQSPDRFCAKAQKLSGVHRTNCGDYAKPQSRALRFPQFCLHSLTRLL